MRIAFNGTLRDEPRIRAGLVGCGSHAFRNIVPTFQFAPVELVATCDRDVDKARAYADQFGAASAYGDHRVMLERERLDAVFVVLGYDERGRPQYPRIAADAMQAGCHAWIEKPPAASCAEIARLQQLSRETGKHVLVGFKKMFFPANEKAAELMRAETFGAPSLVLLQYPQHLPTAEQFAAYAAGEGVGEVIGFLDHLCHPASLMVFLLGMPRTLWWTRSSSGNGVATFTFESGTVASLAFTAGAADNGGMERTTIISANRRQHIVVDNNIRVTLYRDSAGRAYGASPDFYAGPAEGTAATWEPEFSLGQLYNKGLFLLGYYGEVNAFAEAVLADRAPAKGTLEQAWQVTRLFEAFAEGPDRLITLD